MTDSKLMCFIVYCAVFSATVCLVDSRPHAGLNSGKKLSQEAISDWLIQRSSSHVGVREVAKKDYEEYQFSMPSSNSSMKEASTVYPRILNHSRRSSTEKLQAGHSQETGSPNSHSVGQKLGSHLRKEDSVILFPDRLKNKAPLNSFVPDSKVFKECSDGGTFCETIDDYPMHRVKEVLDNEIGKFEGFFGEDKVNEIKIVNRIDAPNEEPLCVSEEKLMFPKAGLNDKNDMLFIVNDGKYVQGVRVENCRKTGPCTYDLELPFGRRAECGQKYIYRRLLALNNETGQLQANLFPIPSCCVCSVRNGGLNSRIGGISAKSGTTPVAKGKPGKGEASTPSDTLNGLQNDDPTPPENVASEDVVSSKDNSARIVFEDELRKPASSPNGEDHP